MNDFSTFEIGFNLIFYCCPIILNFFERIFDNDYMLYKRFKKIILYKRIRVDQFKNKCMIKIIIVLIAVFILLEMLK